MRAQERAQGRARREGTQRGHTERAHRESTQREHTERAHRESTRREHTESAHREHIFHLKFIGARHKCESSLLKIYIIIVDQKVPEGVRV